MVRAGRNKERGSVAIFKRSKKASSMVMMPFKQRSEGIKELHHVKIWREWQALRALGGFLALYPCGVSHLAVPELNPFTVKDM